MARFKQCQQILRVTGQPEHCIHSNSKAELSSFVKTWAELACSQSEQDPLTQNSRHSKTGFMLFPTYLDFCDLQTTNDMVIGDWWGLMPIRLCHKLFEMVGRAWILFLHNILDHFAFWARSLTCLEIVFLIFFSVIRQNTRHFFPKKVFGHNFWLECPTDLRTTSLSCIFDALFEDTPYFFAYARIPI